MSPLLSTTFNVDVEWI